MKKSEVANIALSDNSNNMQIIVPIDLPLQLIAKTGQYCQWS